VSNGEYVRDDEKVKDERSCWKVEAFWFWLKVENWKMMSDCMWEQSLSWEDMLDSFKYLP